MEILKLKEIAKACDGICVGNDEVEITNVCIDTRKITEGCLFICIKGERFDAHQFANEALEKGAVGVVVDQDIQINGNYVKVDNTSKALLDLGGYYRSKFEIPIVALTGSVGKTTTKEFTHLVVNSKYKTIKTLGNLNNEIGLPQMLFQIDNNVQAAVIEMGMNHFGEISRLTNATKPTIALITNIGVSHIENLGSRQGILQAKLEILEGLQKGSVVVLNGDDDMLSTVENENYKIFRYGINNGDFIAENIVENDNSTSFNVSYFGKSQEIIIPTIGIHNVYNALAAFAIGYFLDVDSVQSAKALFEYEPAGMRQRVVKKGDVTVIEDCYNASPDSMKAAIQTLKNTKGNKKIAVLADMLELGDYAEKAHTQVGEYVAENSIDYLLAYGDNARYYLDIALKKSSTQGFLFSDKESLSNKLLQLCQAGDVVLFKGSRGMKLEEIMNIVYKGWDK